MSAGVRPGAATGARAVRRGGLGFAATVGADARLAGRALAAALAGAGFDAGELVKLNVYYPEGLPAGAVLGTLGAELPAPGAAIGALPLPRLPGLEPLVRVEAVAAAGERRPVDGAVRVGDLVWTSAVTVSDAPGDLVRQTEVVLDRLRRTLAGAGATLDDAIKVNIFYVGAGTAEDWEAAARVRGAAVREPAAAATGIPVGRFADDRVLTSIEVWAARGSAEPPLGRQHHWPEGHWDWPIHLPWKHGCRCGNVVTVGGQVSLRGAGQVVDPGDLARQVPTSLANVERVLAGLGAGRGDVLRATAFYERRRPEDDELVARALADAFPAAATLPVPLACLAYRDMVVEIEVVAVT